MFKERKHLAFCLVLMPVAVPVLRGSRNLRLLFVAVVKIASLGG